MTDVPPRLAFPAYITQLQDLLDRRQSVSDGIAALLGAQNRAAAGQQDKAVLARGFSDCFGGRNSLCRQLEEAHWSSGFRPRDNAGNDLFDPLEMLLRGIHFWRQTRWPGNKARIRYAHTLFNLYLLRCLALLSMRLWDTDEDGQLPPEQVSERLASLQGVLDQLWQGSPDDQPVLVHDVRWLLPLAMSPTTDELSGYFEVATKIADTFSEADRLETQKAWVQTGAGHLCSQLRHLCVQRETDLHDHRLKLLTRLSNALDVTLIMEGLVTLFDAYQRAVSAGDQQQRLALAAAICHGVSPDPELFLRRLDLLAPYTMIEYLFITSDGEGRAVYTAMGKRHRSLLEHYNSLVSRLLQPLHEDCRQCRPTAEGYAPYGVLFGFSSNLIELMAFKTLQRDTVLQYSLEDIFTAGDAGKRAWVNGWRQLPHIDPAVSRQFEYPQDFAAALHQRIEDTLDQAHAAADTALPPCGRLCLNNADGEFPPLPLQYIESSDSQLVADGRAVHREQPDMLSCRMEGEYLLSYQTAGGWLGLSKDLLSEVCGTGRNAALPELPETEAAILRLMCPELIG